jgi:DNA-binding transcriptional regulator YiaG
MAKKSGIENELIAGLKEVLDHKRGKKKLRGQRRELPAPAPEWTAREIKRFREETMQMSQTEFAALLNVKAPTVRAWEQGLNVPSGAAARLLQALEKDPTLVEKLIA